MTPRPTSRPACDRFHRQHGQGRRIGPLGRLPHSRRPHIGPVHRPSTTHAPQAAPGSRLKASCAAPAAPGPIESPGCCCSVSGSRYDRAAATGSGGGRQRPGLVAPLLSSSHSPAAPRSRPAVLLLACVCLGGPALAAAVAAAAAAGGAAAARVPLPPPRFPRPARRLQASATAQQHCTALAASSTAAIDELLALPAEGVPWAEFLAQARRHGLEGELRRAARGRALVLPTNAALAAGFVPLGLFRQPPSLVPAGAVAALRQLVQTGVAVPRVSTAARRSRTHEGRAPPWRASTAAPAACVALALRPLSLPALRSAV